MMYDTICITGFQEDVFHCKSVWTVEPTQISASWRSTSIPEFEVDLIITETSWKCTGRLEPGSDPVPLTSTYNNTKLTLSDRHGHSIVHTSNVIEEFKDNLLERDLIEKKLIPDVDVYKQYVKDNPESKSAILAYHAKGIAIEPIDVNRANHVLNRT